MNGVQGARRRRLLGRGIALASGVVLLVLLALALSRPRLGHDAPAGGQAATGPRVSAGSAPVPASVGAAGQLAQRVDAAAHSASATGLLALGHGSATSPPAMLAETVLPGVGPVCGLAPAVADAWLATAATASAARAAPAAGGPVLLPPAIGWPPLRQAWLRMHQQLIASAEPAQRVAGWLLGPAPPELYGAEPAASGPSVRPEPLRALLAGTDDPLALALGVQACSLPGQAPLCDPATLVRRWLRAAPDNIAPWLALAEAEPGAVDEALAGAARATRWDDGHGRLLGFALGAWPADAPPHVLADASMTWLVLEATLAGRGSGLTALRRACREARATGDLTRQGWCESIARQAVTRAPHGLGRLEGWGLGALLGWPKDELARLRGALAVPAPVLPWMRPDRYGCEAIAEARATLRLFSTHGELAALRAPAASR